MPKNPKIQKVLVLGSGPIVIGQAAEFDYAGAQACRILKPSDVVKQDPGFDRNHCIQCRPNRRSW